MRLLKNVYFLNSGAMPYCKVKLDGNIHITGKNGSGKTSILRAILFFYNPVDQNQGLGDSKKNFVDFYFPDINSFIVYEVEKETFTYIVIAYKRQNRVCFRIAETVFREEDFISDKRQVKTLQEVIQSLTYNKTYIFPKTIDTNKGFISFIYGSEIEYKRYSIFEGKGFNYQNIPRTISNIFHNYRLETSFIKRSIMNSIMEEMPAIDLAKIKHQLGDFDKSFNDIKAFDNHSASGKLICKVYSRLTELEADKKEIARMLGYRINFSKLEKLRLEAAARELEIHLAEIKKQLDGLTLHYNTEERQLSFKIQKYREKIEEAENKKQNYQTIGIDKIIEAVESESSLDKQLKILVDELDLLLSEHKDIKRRYEDLKNGILNSIREKDIEFNEQKFKTNLQTSHEKDEVKKVYDALAQELKNKYQKSFDEINAKSKSIKEEITKLIVQRPRIEVSVPFVEKIDEFKERLENHNKEISERKSSLQKLDGQLKLSQQELESKINVKNSQLVALEEKQTNEIKKLETKLLQIEDNLKLVEKSFSGFLEKNYSGYLDNISKVISEEVLFNTELEPKIIEKNDLLFGIKLNLSKLAPAKTTEAYIEQKEQLLLDISKLRQDLENNLFQLKGKFDDEENIINRKISENEKNQAKFKKEIDTFNIHLETAQTQLKTKLEESDKKRKLDLEQLDEEILKYRSVLANLDLQEANLKTELKNESNLFEAEKKTKLEVLDKRNKDNIENVLAGFNDYKGLALKKLAEIDSELQNDLQTKGANEPKIRELEGQKNEIIKTKDFIKKSQQKYHEYLKDKRELIDRVEEFQVEIARTEKEKEAKQKDYQGAKGELNQVQELKKADYSNQNKILNSLLNDLENFETFKSGPLFAELAHYISEENFFLTNDKKISGLINDLSSVYHELTNKSNTLREKITTFTSFFDESNIFDFKILNNTEQDFRNFAQNLKSFIEDDKIKEYQQLLSKSYFMIVSNLSRQIDELTSKEGEIHKTINKINNSFEKASLIDVIKEIELRIKESNNQVITYLRKIKEFADMNPFVGDFNLFNQSPNQENELRAIELLKKLKQAIQESKLERITLEESFDIGLRVIENNNDTGFTERISTIGSNGTDVLVKALIYITLLDIAKYRLKLNGKDFKIHCIVDEVGILDNNYLKYLIQFANDKNILLLNSSPNTVEASLYEHIYRVKKDQKSNSNVYLIIGTKINEIINQPSQDVVTAN